MQKLSRPARASAAMMLAIIFLSSGLMIAPLAHNRKLMLMVQHH